jgi:ribonuclease BN (tRNA processing enzyme)
MDAGPGTFMALLDVMDPVELDAVFLSHRHPDHCSDIFALFHTRAYGHGSSGSIPVFVPEGLVEALAAFVSRSADSMRGVFDFHVLEAGDTFSVGSIEGTVTQASHPVPTIAPRLSAGGRVLAYTADSGPSNALVSLANGADLLLSEASHGGVRSADTEAPLHMTAFEAGELAAAAGVRKLMLTHIAPYLDPTQSLQDAESMFDGEVTLAVAGTRHTL